MLNHDSSHFFHRMIRLESQLMTRCSSQSHFYKISESLTDRPSSFAHREMSIFASVIIKIGANVLFRLSSRLMLPFQDHVSQLSQRYTWDFALHWGGSRAQYIDTLSWFDEVFAYRDHGSGPHSVTLSLFHIPVKWFKFFKLKSNPKIILQNIMQIRKLNLVEIEIPVTVVSISPCGDEITPHITFNS